MKASKLPASERQIGGKHYDVPLQPFEFAIINGLSMIEGETIKYIVRARRKNGKQDLDKAIHCLEMLKEWHYKFLALCVPHHVLRAAEFIEQFGLGIHETRALWSIIFAIEKADGHYNIAIRELQLAKHSYKNKKVVK